MINLWEELHTDRLILRKINFEDIDFVFNHFKDEEVCRYMVDNEPMGTIGFHRLDRNNNIAEIGYDLGKLHWKQGLMSEAMSVVLI